MTDEDNLRSIRSDIGKNEDPSSVEPGFSTIALLRLNKFGSDYAFCTNRKSAHLLGRKEEMNDGTGKLNKNSYGKEGA
jgi:hypothetical protein